MSLPPTGARRAARPQRLRRWPRRLALLAAATSLVLVTAEAALRLTTHSWLGAAANQRGLYRIGSDGYFRPSPGWSGTVTWKGHAAHVQLDSLGLRGPEVPPRRPGELRVLLAGDSVTFGFAVDLRDTFAARLEPLLEERLGRPVTVRIGGGPGLGTFDVAGIIGDVRDAYDPDLVLCGVFLGNDLEDNFQVSRAVVDGYALVGPVARTARASWRLQLALRSRLWLFAEHWLTRWGLGVPCDLAPEQVAFRDFPPPGARRGGVFLDRDPETPENERILDRLDQGLRAVVAAAGGRRVGVVLLPTPAQCRPEVWSWTLRQNGWDAARFRRNAVLERVAAHVARLGLPFHDLTPALSRGGGARSRFLPEDAHLSPEGHAVVARDLVPFVLGLTE